MSKLQLEILRLARDNPALKRNRIAQICGCSAGYVTIVLTAGGQVTSRYDAMRFTLESILMNLDEGGPDLLHWVEQAEILLYGEKLNEDRE